MAIKFELIINASSDKVFKAVTTKKGYQGWWAKVCDVDCKMKGISSIRFEKDDITEEMIFKATEVEPNKKLVWLCTSNNVFETWVGSTIIFDMEPQGKNTLLKFTHTNPDKNWKKHPDYSGSLAGWEFFIESLKDYCENGKGSPWG